MFLLYVNYRINVFNGDMLRNRRITLSKLRGRLSGRWLVYMLIKEYRKRNDMNKITLSYCCSIHSASSECRCYYCLMFIQLSEFAAIEICCYYRSRHVVRIINSTRCQGFFVFEHSFVSKKRIGLVSSMTMLLSIA